VSRPFKSFAIFGALAAASVLWLGATQAQAADSVCTAALPAAGTVIRGPVLEIEDGETLCVALGETPDQWLRLTLADAPVDNPVRRAAFTTADDNPRGTLMAVAFARTVDCRIEDGGRALCALDDGRSVGALLKTRTAQAAGRDWR
jgi:hypothetical protein